MSYLYFLLVHNLCISITNSINIINMKFNQYILKFQSTPIIARIDYYNTSVGKSKLKYRIKDSILELYVLTIQGELWQIYLNIEPEDVHFKKYIAYNYIKYIHIVIIILS